MDGQFVDDITFGHPVVKYLRQNLNDRQHADAFLDMHMMVAKPEKYIVKMAEAGASQYTFHYEAASDVGEVIRKIKENGLRVGLGIKPNTPVESILPFMNEIDMALIMTVEPGKGGQKFMQDMLPKAKFLRERFPYVNIQVDGGVGLANLDICAEHGVNMIVAGTSLLKSQDRPGDIIKMRNIIEAKLSKGLQKAS